VSAIPPWTAAARRDDWGQGYQGDGPPPAGVFKASTWELEDAEEEELKSRQPRPETLRAGTWEMVGMEFEAAGVGHRRQTFEDNRFPHSPCDDVILAIGQEAASLDRAGYRNRIRRAGPPRGRRDTFMSTVPASSLAATRPGARRTSFGPSPTGTKPPSPFINYVPRKPVTLRPPEV